MKQNPLIEKAVVHTIRNLLKRGELLTREQAEQLALENLKVQTHMMTIALNQACGIGKLRFQRDVQPILEELYQQWQEDQKTVDQEYADERMQRLYDEIML